MKAVFVGKIGTAKLYYVTDAKDKESDGVLVEQGKKPQIISFWEIVVSRPGLKKLASSKFHQWLWEKPDDDKRQLWYRNFIFKTQPIDERLLRGVPVNSDIMKAGSKTKSLNLRAAEFKDLAISQNLYEIRRKTQSSNERI